MNQEKIGKFISECRRKKKITQQELAEKLGVSDRTIGNWENGRNMPDLSLFKPLCEELDISINDLISGEKVKVKDYQEKLEENIINTIDYSNNRFIKNNKNTAWILIIIGLIMSISALTIFQSESSWGSIYSVLGGIISIVGFSRFTKKLSYGKRLLFNYGYFIIFIIVLFTLDYIGVLLNKQAPRFSYEKETINNMIIYKAPFCNVYQINYDTKNEYYIIDSKKEYNKDTIPYTPFDRDKSGIDTIIKYKNKYIGNNSNTGNLINHLPLSEYGYTFEIDSDNLGLTINYHITDWYINENYYLEKSLIYNSISMFSLIDNLTYINYNFSGKSYKITKKAVKNSYPNFDYINKEEIDKFNFNEYLEKKINDNDFIHHTFKVLFIDENLVDTNKIVVKNYTDEKIIKTITDKEKLNEVINLISRATKITGPVNFDGAWWNIYMYDKEEQLVYKLYGWGTNNNYSISFGIDGKEYMLVGLDGKRFKELIQG